MFLIVIIKDYIKFFLAIYLTNRSKYARVRSCQQNFYGGDIIGNLWNFEGL